MKKRILCLLLCLLTLLPLTSCSTEKHELLYSETHGSLEYNVRGSGNRAKQIVVKKGDEILFAEKIKVHRKVGSLGGSYGFEVTDLNFDGYDDMMIVNEKADDQKVYTCWLWDPDSESFYLHKGLTGLCNVKSDPVLQAVFAFSHSYSHEKAYDDAPEANVSTDATTKYIWVDEKLTPQVRASITYYSETDLYCYSVAYYDQKSEGFLDSDDKWLTPEEYKEQDMSFLYYFQ